MTIRTDLSCASVGGEIVFATDEWFAPAINLLSPRDPKFIPDKYTEFGKWMDGWETRRKRIAGHDWCIIKLGVPGIIYSIEVSTLHFTGNHSPRISVQAANIPFESIEISQLRKKFSSTERIGKCPSPDDFAMVETLKSEEWDTVVPFTELEPGYPDYAVHKFAVKSNSASTHIRLNLYPDGGIARIRTYGRASVDTSIFESSELNADLASICMGAEVVYCTNAHFGRSSNLILPGRGTCMGDGWETARKPNRPSILRVDSNGLIQAPGSDSAVIRLCAVGRIHTLIIDTHYFKGNFPESVQIDGILLGTREAETADWESKASSFCWTPILNRTKVVGDREHKFEVYSQDYFSHIRLTIFPDGGIMRLRAHGSLAVHGRSAL